MKLKSLYGPAPRKVTKTRGNDQQAAELLRAYGRNYYRLNRKKLLKKEKLRLQNDPTYKHRKNIYAKRWARKTRNNVSLLARHLWKRAFHRAKSYGIKFTISLDDIIIPERCPVFGFKLRSSLGENVGRGAQNAKYNAPALDRVNSKKGYIKGNVVVISQRANVLKRDASLEELKKLVRWLGRITR